MYRRVYTIEQTNGMLRVGVSASGCMCTYSYLCCGYIGWVLGVVWVGCTVKCWVCYLLGVVWVGSGVCELLCLLGVVAAWVVCTAVCVCTVLHTVHSIVCVSGVYWSVRVVCTGVCEWCVVECVSGVYWSVWVVCTGVCEWCVLKRVSGFGLECVYEWAEEYL